MYDGFLYCKWCMEEYAIFPIAGHKKGIMDLGCENCHRQISRLKLNALGEWELDASFYLENK